MELLCGMSRTGALKPPSAHDDLTYGLFAYFEVRCTTGIGCCAALRSSYYFGRGGARNSLDPTPREFAASVYLFLFRGNCLHFLVWRDRAGPAGTLTFLCGAERSLCSGQNPRLFFGILPCHFRNIWRGRELV